MAKENYIVYDQIITNNNPITIYKTEKEGILTHVNKNKGKHLKKYKITRLHIFDEVVHYKMQGKEYKNQYSYIRRIK